MNQYYYQGPSDDLEERTSFQPLVSKSLEEIKPKEPYFEEQLAQEHYVRYDPPFLEESFIKIGCALGGLCLAGAGALLIVGYVCDSF